MLSLSKVLAVTALCTVTTFTQATPIDLGGAEKYTLLSMGEETQGDHPGGNLQLGSEAYIYGNVGSRYQLEMADGAIVYGDADYGSVDLEGSAQIKGASTVKSEAYWDGLYNDLLTASDYASSLSGESVGYVNSSKELTATGGLSVFNIEQGINLGGGSYLTLIGDIDDQIIVNVDGHLNLGSGAGILLSGGILADNVLFNITYSSAMFGGAEFSGTYISSESFFTVGDGAIMKDTRILTHGIQGNLQDVGTPDSMVTKVPAPSAWLLMLVGLLGLAYVRKSA